MENFSGLNIKFLKVNIVIAILKNHDIIKM